MKINAECWVKIRFDMSQVSKEQMFRLEDLLSEMGIHFDRGSGCGERHWEWDRSLEGPVRVTFVGETSNPSTKVMLGA